MLRRGLSLVLALTMMALGSSGVSAQRDHDDLARVHFQSGSAYFEIGDYEAAVREFEAAYRVSPRDLLLFNLYLAHERLGNIEEAFGYLERYLAADPQIPQQEKNTLALRLENMRARLGAAQEAEVALPPPEPTVLIVQVPVEALEPEAEATEAPPEAAPPPAEEAGREPNIGGIISFSVAGAGLGIMVTAGAMAFRQDRKLKDACAPPATYPCASDDETDRLARLTKTADIGLLIGGVGIIAGILFYVLDRGEDVEEDEARLRIAPWVGSDVAGLAARGSF